MFQLKNCYFTAPMLNFLRPYNILGLFGVLLTIMSLLVSSTIDIHFHDTYYIIGFKDFFWLFGLIFLFFAIIYRISRKILLSKYLTWLHIIITLLSFITLVVLVMLGDNPSRRYIDTDPWSNFNKFNGISNIISWTMIVFLAGQIVFVVNITGRVLKKISSFPGESPQH